MLPRGRRTNLEPRQIASRYPYPFPGWSAAAGFGTTTALMVHGVGRQSAEEKIHHSRYTVRSTDYRALLRIHRGRSEVLCNVDRRVPSSPPESRSGPASCNTRRGPTVASRGQRSLTLEVGSWKLIQCGYAGTYVQVPRQTDGNITVVYHY